jgi:hypothetical protein
MNTDPKETDVNTTAATAPRVSYWAKPNHYAATCVACGSKVAAKQGWTQKDRDSGKWVTYCHPCAKANSRSLPDGTGAVSMAGAKDTYDLHICSRCGARVGLCKSKAGKWYLAQVRQGSYGEYRTKVMPWLPHSQDAGTCQTHQEHQAEYRRSLAESLAETRKHIMHTPDLTDEQRKVALAHIDDAIKRNDDTEAAR